VVTNFGEKVKQKGKKEYSIYCNDRHNNRAKYKENDEIIQRK